MNTLRLAIFLTLSALCAHAEVVMEQWVNRYNKPSAGEDLPTVIALDSAGNVIVTGYSRSRESGGDFYTAKYRSADGALFWEQRSGETGDNDESPKAMAVDGAGNIIVTGWSLGSDTAEDYYTVKYAAASGALLWYKRYNGPGNEEDIPAAVVIDSAGNVIVTGSSRGSGSQDDFYTVKYAAADGAVLWERRYNSPTNGRDAATAAALDSVGNVIVTGYTTQGIYPDYYTAKYASADGSLLWEKRYDGPANGVDTPCAVKVDNAGNVIVAGTSFGIQEDFYTVKYAGSDGGLLWEKRSEDPLGVDTYALAMTLDGAGNAIVTGVAHYFRDDFYTVKYAAGDGALLWVKQHDGLPENGFARSVAVDAAGNVIVTGGSPGAAAQTVDFYSAKYAAADGALLWEKLHVGTSRGGARAVAVDGAGDVFVTGGSLGNGTSSDYYTVKQAGTTGALIWENRYNGEAGSYSAAHAVILDTAGNVVVTGEGISLGLGGMYTAMYAATDGRLLWEKLHDTGIGHAVTLDGAGNVVVAGTSSKSYYAENDFYTAKYAASNGALLWEKSYNGPGNYHDIAIAVAVDSVGNVIVTGSSIGSLGYDFYTAKYAAADGALLWEKRLDGPGHDNDHPHALVVDSAGNVIVAGSSYGLDTSQDFYAVKYAAADGAILWEKRYNGPANHNDEANAITVDGAGNVIVTGSSEDSLSRPDFYTAKYAAANGALLWEKRYDGPANGDDRAYAVTLDSAGNVFVTGTSTGIGTEGDFYTAKYGASNGALLWEKRYNGPAGHYDESRNVALDDAGNVIVAGWSADSLNNGDFYTAKYAGADGTLLWEMRYNGPDNGHDRIYNSKQLAVAPGGIVAIAGVSSGQFTTVKYAPAVDADHDGLLDPWELRHFGTTAGHSALDDSDGDGRVELLELALATDPVMPNAGPTTAIVVEGGYLTTTIAKQAGFAYAVESSGALQNAAFSAATTTVLTDNATTLKVRDNFIVGSTPRRFLRLKVTVTP